MVLRRGRVQFDRLEPALERRLAVGQRADFLVLDRDPLMANAAELRQIKVLQTWVGGMRVYGGEAAAPDEDRRRVTR